MKLKKMLVIGLILVSLVVALSACGSQNVPSSQDPSSDNGVQVVPQEDPNATIDGMLGEWTQVGQADRFVKIEKSGNGYQLTDNEGTYSATYAKGILDVMVTDLDKAEALVDTKTKHLFVFFQNQTTEYQKKQ